MMKAMYLDCFSGISGNMLLGAFLQAGVPVEYLTNELGKLLPADEFKLNVSPVKKNGVAAVHVDVEVKYIKAVFQPADKEKPEINLMELNAESGHHHYHHQHRTMGEIAAMIEESSLSATVKKTSLKIFTCLAEAEAKVHGTEVNEVKFHEVGAVDSIVDIVGTAIALDYLKIGKMFVSKVNTGSGFVQCAHGTMMVPAPATAELLLGVPSYHSGQEKELTTPTGAAVIKALAAFADNIPAGFNTEKIVYGAGTWDLDIPNVLRVFIGDCPDGSEQKYWLVETNIDDMMPQIFGYVFEKLLDAGALDVWVTPVVMKKNRPAHVLSVLTDEGHKEACCDIIFTETTSIGLRIQAIEQRREAIRRIAKVPTEYGDVDCKVSVYKGEIVSVSAEYDDCRRLAIEHKVPLKKVRRAAMTEIGRRLE